MSYRFIICPDPEEGHTLSANNVFYANTQSQVEQRIKDASCVYPASTICVYGLAEMLKLNTPTTTAQFQSSNNVRIIVEAYVKTKTL